MFIGGYRWLAWHPAVRIASKSVTKKSVGFKPLAGTSMTGSELPLKAVSLPLKKCANPLQNKEPIALVRGGRKFNPYQQHQKFLRSKDCAYASAPFALSISRAVHNRKYDYLAAIIVHLVDDDVGIFEELTRPFDQTRPPHVGELVGFQEAYSVADRLHHPDSRRRAVLRNPLSNMIEIGLSRLSDDNFHTP
jgi:hypothetical protein